MGGFICAGKTHHSMKKCLYLLVFSLRVAWRLLKPFFYIISSQREALTGWGAVSTQEWLFYFIKLFYFIGTSFSFRSILLRTATEGKLLADMMFPRSRRGLAPLLTVIYFSVSIAPSLPSLQFVEWCANPLYSSDKCIDQYKQTAGHRPKWKP